MSLSELTAKLLSDIRTLRPDQLSYWTDFFHHLLSSPLHKWNDYTLTYDAGTHCYELCYWEQGRPVGGIRETSINAFRLRFIKDRFFPNWNKATLETAIAAMYPILGDTEEFTAFVHYCETRPCKHGKLGPFDFTTMTFASTSPERSSP